MSISAVFAEIVTTAVEAHDYGQLKTQLQQLCGRQNADENIFRKRVKICRNI